MKQLTIFETDTIKKALNIIDKGLMRLAIIINNDNKVVGILNDGDIRRALLKGYNLDDTIKNIYNKDFVYCYIDESKDDIIKKAIQYKVYQIPILDYHKNLVEVIDLATLLENRSRKNKVILMAGGLGQRLRPLTNNIPKPLIKVGNKPILENIINNFANYGFKNIIISINYKANMIKDYFKDGKEFGVNISYIEEKEKLGTAGALSLLKEFPKEPFFVANGDILTKVNFKSLLDFHCFGKSIATMCVREYNYQIPYGVIDINNDKIISIKEKPIYNFFVNAGIYVLNPEVINYIPKNKYFDMTSLFEILIKNKKNILSFPIHEYWLDIGRFSDLEKAQEDIKIL